MEDILTRNWGKKLIIMPDNAIQMRPTEIHLKENGAKNNKPSLCIVMEIPGQVPKVYGQISIAMLNEALNELGYCVTPIKIE